MVNLSEIPCVGGSVDRIADATDAVFRGFRYTFRYKDSFVLDFAIWRLNYHEKRVSRRIDEKRFDGKIIQDRVLMWLQHVREINESYKEFSDKYRKRPSWRCIPFLPIPNLVTRYKLSREAEHIIRWAIRLRSAGFELLDDEIAHIDDNNVPKDDDDTVYQDLQSRRAAYEKLRQALVDETSLIIGIYGMGGVGKTTMINRIWKEAKANKMFDTFSRVDVGREDLEVIKLQNQIAYDLNCNFDNVESRASQLKNCFKNGGKVLIILDDVWQEIDFGKIGISFGNASKGCKILLASRSKDVCLINKCKHPIEIATLTSDESQNLFTNYVGAEKISSLQDKTLLEEICKKCQDSPLLISLVSKVFRFTDNKSWNDALRQLESDKVEKIPGIDPQVYACIKLSIDSLKEDAKSCLFFCSLFPEFADIPTQKLVKLATDLLVPAGEYEIFAMLDTLRSSSLLFDSKLNHLIKSKLQICG